MPCVVDRRPRNALGTGLRAVLLMVGEAHPSLKPQVAEAFRLLMLPSAAQVADLVLGPGDT
eukprot:7643157-Lingulodinium_polyedra.AAC.1